MAFKVALIGYEGQTVPDWIFERMVSEGLTFVVSECRSRDELIRHAQDADLVWVFGGSRILLNGEAGDNLAGLPRCGAILRTGSGTDNIPVESATRLGIVVANTPEALSDAVSDHAIGLLLAVVRQIPLQDRAVRGRAWDRNQGFPRSRLRGRTVGLVGFGNIAQAFVRKLSGFQMNFLTYDPYVTSEVLKGHSVAPRELDEVLAQSDFVSLHCPLTKDTTHLIGERQLRLMKPTAVLINTSRGTVVDERMLFRALTEGWIAAAGLDVLETEPPDWNNPLLKLDNVVITPHIAAFSDDYLDESWRLSVDTVVALAQSHWPRSYVNHDVRPRWNLRPAEQMS
ncbi:MAG: C-terminal binding protein [Acidobacteria bacterium]|nr:C-terminal binding protein [Acidobacteriota bacterium]